MPSAWPNATEPAERLRPEIEGPKTITRFRVWRGFAQSLHGVDFPAAAVTMLCTA